MQVTRAMDHKPADAMLYPANLHELNSNRPRLFYESANHVVGHVCRNAGTQMQCVFARGDHFKFGESSNLLCIHSLALIDSL